MGVKFGRMRNNQLENEPKGQVFPHYLEGLKG